MLTLNRLMNQVRGAVLRCTPLALKRLFNRNKTLLSFAAHPDDDTWGWGYLLWRKVTSGWNVISAVATPGDAGNGGLVPGIGAVRMAEQVASCGHLGVNVVRWLGFTESNIELVSFEELVTRIYDLIVEVKATQVVTYGELGLTRHPHHIRMHHAVTEACRRARVSVSYVDATPHWDRHVGAVLQAVGAIGPDVELMRNDHEAAPPKPLRGRARRAVESAVLAHVSQVEPLDQQLSEHGGFPVLEATWLYAANAISAAA